MNRGRQYIFAAYLAITAGHVLNLVPDLSRLGEIQNTDFGVFYGGWSMVLAGQGSALFDIDAQAPAQRAVLGGRDFGSGVVPFLHPPPAALVMSHLALLKLPVAFWLWTFGQILATVFLLRALSRLLPTDHRRSDFWLVVIAVTAFPALFFSLQLGQVSVLLTLAMVKLWESVEEGRDWSAGAWLLVLTLKPHLAVVVGAWLLGARRLRPVVASMGLLAILIAAATLLFGTGVWADYGRLVADHMGRFGGQHGAYPELMPTLRGTLIRVLGGEQIAAINIVTHCSFLCAALAASWLGAKAPRRTGFALSTGLSLLLAPHLFLHDAMMWVLPLMLFARHESVGGTGAFVRFALLWPLVAMIGIVLEPGSTTRFPIAPIVVMSTVAVVWMGKLQARALPAEAR